MAGNDSVPDRDMVGSVPTPDLSGPLLSEFKQNSPALLTSGQEKGMKQMCPSQVLMLPQVTGSSQTFPKRNAPERKPVSSLLSPGCQLILPGKGDLAGTRSSRAPLSASVPSMT